MAVTVTPKEVVNEYFESDRKNQSLIKGLREGLEKFISKTTSEQQLYYEEKGHFIIGGAVDTLLTGTEEDFFQRYHISNLAKKPSDTEMSIIQRIFDEQTEGIEDMNNVPPLFMLKNAILDSVNHHGWQPKYKDETKIQKIIDAGTEYFDDLKKSFGKQIISLDEYNTIKSIVDSLKTNPRTAQYFDRDTTKDNPTVHIFYQLPLYFSIEKIPCKALLDILVVVFDVHGKPVGLHPVDVKTMSGYTINFPGNAKTFRYDIQGAWYVDALSNPTVKSPVEEFNKIIEFMREDSLGDIFIADFTFIVESSTNPGKPLLYVADPSFIEIGRNGFIDPRTSRRKVKGYHQFLSEYVYYENTEWKEEKIVTDNQGVLKFDWDGLMQNEN